MIQKVDKPWGFEIIYAQNEKYAGKILLIRTGEKLSLQYHNRKDETIFVLSGEMDLVVEEDGELTTRRLTKGQGYRIFPGVKHRMIGVSDCEVAEVSSPELTDVVRLEDAYGRTGTTAP